MSEPTFEEAREELAEIVAKLEAGGLTLEESLALWNRGEEVARVCTEWLDKAQAVLDAAAEDGDDADADADADAASGAGDSMQE
ncbi:MAG: exodeoxyribonuclease VII small subunit [Candidatus Nanopelagicales bacterium]|nr:exodeoxyribonuclease VII small subunit [Actinomycetota bacterium]